MNTEANFNDMKGKGKLGYLESACGVFYSYILVHIRVS